MKRVVDLGAFAAYTIPEAELARVHLIHAENPVSAKVDDPDGPQFTVVLSRNGKTVEIDDPCEVEGVCLHAAMVFAAVKSQKKAPTLDLDKALETVIPKEKLAQEAIGKGFRKAAKSSTKLRLAIYGPAGSGKTLSGLRIAKGIGGRMAVIDTENGSSEKYADRYSFDVMRLTDKSPEGYADAMHQAAEGGYNVLLIDSISHEWDELKDFVSTISLNPRHKGNTWSAWSEGTPKHKAFVQEILNFPAHLIVTIRAKTEWSTEDRNGRKTPVRLGLTPESGKGIEYEFDMLMAISPDHVVSVEKDRTGKYQDQTIKLPDEKLGEDLRKWLEG
jgi:hypothetical protein